MVRKSLISKIRSLAGTLLVAESEELCTSCYINVVFDTETKLVLVLVSRRKSSYLLILLAFAVITRLLEIFIDLHRISKS